MADPILEDVDAPSNRRTPYSFTEDSAFHGDIRQRGDRDYVAFEVEAGGYYAFTLDSRDDEDDPLAEPQLNLYDSDGDFLADAGSQLFGNYYDYETIRPEGPATVYYVFDTAKTVYLAAIASDFNETGDYKLSAQRITPPPMDVPGDTSTTATLAPGSTIEESFETSRDSDWFKIEAAPGQIVTLTLDSTGETPVYNAAVTLFDSDGDEIFVSRSRSLESPVSTSIAVTTEDPIYVRAEGYGAIVDYSLTAEIVTYGRDDLVHSPATTGTLASGEALSSRIDGDLDIDWIAVEVEAGGSYNFTLLSDADSDDPLNFADFRVVDSDGVALTTQFEYTDGSIGMIRYDAETDATVYVEVGAYLYSDYYYGGTFGETGDYTVIMSENPREETDAPSDVSTPYLLSAGSEFLGSIRSDDTDAGDWVRLELLGGNHYTLSVTPRSVENGLFDPQMVLYAEDGTPVVTIDDAGSSLDPSMVLAVPVDATYFVGIGPSSTAPDDTGRYTFAVEPTSIFRTLFGSEGPDLMSTELIAGSTIYGRGGDDILFGDETRNTLYGESGRDLIDGGAGRDFISGGKGGDLVQAGRGADRVFGDSGNDRLGGQAGPDRLYGGSGNDTVFGGRGNDLLDGQGGRNKLQGGAGEDTFILTKGKALVTDFDPAEDRLSFSNALYGFRTLTPEELVDRYAETDGTDTLFAFKGGSWMALRGIDDPSVLVDLIDFV